MEDNKPELKDPESGSPVLLEEEKSTAQSTFDTKHESPKASNELYIVERNDQADEDEENKSESASQRDYAEDEEPVDDELSNQDDMEAVSNGSTFDKYFLLCDEPPEQVVQKYAMFPKLNDSQEVFEPFPDGYCSDEPA